MSRALARIGLPVRVYTQWYWKCDLHNMLRCPSLRMDAHAQKEIREYADAMYALLEPIGPAPSRAVLALLEGPLAAPSPPPPSSASFPHPAMPLAISTKAVACARILTPCLRLRATPQTYQFAGRLLVGRAAVASRRGRLAPWCQLCAMARRASLSPR